MMRAFALGLAVATQRLIIIPLVVFAGVTAEQAVALNVPTFALGFILNALVVELLIRRLDAPVISHRAGRQAHAAQLN